MGPRHRGGTPGSQRPPSDPAQLGRCRRGVSDQARRLPGPLLSRRLGDEDVAECLGASDGKPVWKTAVPTRYRDALGKGDGPRATPLVAGGRVYVLGANGLLQCLELDSGKPVWRKELLKEYKVKE